MNTYKWISKQPAPEPELLLPRPGMRVLANDTEYIICQCRPGEDLWGIIDYQFSDTVMWCVEYSHIVGWLNKHCAKLASRAE